jgi:ubiquinone/menaquinone biosynthesis C-methylase UbiE
MHSTGGALALSPGSESLTVEVQMLEERKRKEQELHDVLRGDLESDSRLSANKKWYAIAESNRQFVGEWLAARCKGKRVLDYCCGNGDWAIWLAEQGAEAVGIDISPVSIENARKAADARGVGGRCRFFVMDAEAMGFEDDAFDYAVINGVLHHLDIQNAYRELARVLCPSGEAIATEPLKYNPLFQAYRRLTPHLRTEWEVDHILGTKEIYKAREYFNGVEVVRFFHLATLAAVPFRNTRLFEPLCKGLEAVDSLLLRVPGLKWQAWMVIFVLSEPIKARTC